MHRIAQKIHSGLALRENSGGPAIEQVRIGVDLGGTKIEALAIDARGTELKRIRVLTPQHDYAATIDAIRVLVRNLETVTGPAAAVGVGIPGAISPVTGLVKNANSVWLIGHRLAQDLGAALNRPVRLANDANCFALSEAIDGAAAGAKVVFGIIVGTGTGGGIVVDRQPIVGVNAVAGEWGHNPLPWPTLDELPGRSCYCGRRGCIETFLSGPGLTADFATTTGEQASAETIVQRALAGEAGAEQVLTRYEHRMARAVATIINVLDPDVIVVGGGLSNMTRIYESIPRLWGPFVFSDHVTTRFVRAAHGDSSGVRGAAWLWLAEEVSSGLP